MFSARLRGCATLKKSDLLTREIRILGKDSFEIGDFVKSIQLYNYGICVAENDYEELSICYANRSACFFKLKKYKLCLADIELAKKNKYPARLMPKLDRRKIECTKLLVANGDEDCCCCFCFVSCFSNGLEVKFSKKYGNHIMTNRDPDIGQTVIVERALVHTPTNENAHCANCSKFATNAIPCTKCVCAIFCFEECRNDANDKYHGVVCRSEIMFEIVHQNLVLRSIIVAIKAFSTPEALMAAVEKFRTQNGNETNFADPVKRDYFQFFKLRSNVDEKAAHERNCLKQKTMYVVEILARLSGIKGMFRSTKIARFLSHLALNHMHIIVCNAFVVSDGIGCSVKNELGIEGSAERMHTWDWQ